MFACLLENYFRRKNKTKRNTTVARTQIENPLFVMGIFASLRKGEEANFHGSCHQSWLWALLQPGLFDKECTKQAAIPWNISEKNAHQNNLSFPESNAEVILQTELFISFGKINRDTEGIKQSKTSLFQVAFCLCQLKNFMTIFFFIFLTEGSKTKTGGLVGHSLECQLS